MNRTSTALPSASYQANVRKVTLLALLVLLAAVCYMVVAVNFGSQHLMLYSMKIRTPKLVVMLITAFAIGGASIVFQSIINNTIVTPCLLGMNSLYTLIHTAVVFFAGSGSLLARSANLSFAADVILMGIVATIIYSYLFQKTNHNVLYAQGDDQQQAADAPVVVHSQIDGLVLAQGEHIQQGQIPPQDEDQPGQQHQGEDDDLGVDVFKVRHQGGEQAVVLIGVHHPGQRGLDAGEKGGEHGADELCIAVATAMVGPISFLGLIIANIARQLFKTYRHTYLILGSALVGMVVLVAGQLVVERIYHYAVPISVFITVGGGIYFLYLLLSNRRV